jgi:hypothetical protein
MQGENIIEISGGVSFHEGIFTPPGENLLDDMQSG